jgi:hypothetical protein
VLLDEERFREGKKGVFEGWFFGERSIKYGCLTLIGALPLAAWASPGVSIRK